MSARGLIFESLIYFHMVYFIRNLAFTLFRMYYLSSTGLLLVFSPILAENWVGPSNARTVNWQATDCVPLAHVELQTVLELFTAASCNTAARFELLPSYNTPIPILCKKIVLNYLFIVFEA
jgi:hypothetical protein